MRPVFPIDTAGSLSPVVADSSPVGGFVSGTVNCVFENAVEVGRDLPAQAVPASDSIAANDAAAAASDAKRLVINSPSGT
jgi:hypothetical protein